MAASFRILPYACCALHELVTEMPRDKTSEVPLKRTTLMYCSVRDPFLNTREQTPGHELYATSGRAFRVDSTLSRECPALKCSYFRVGWVDLLRVIGLCLTFNKIFIPFFSVWSSLCLCQQKNLKNIITSTVHSFIFRTSNNKVVKKIIIKEKKKKFKTRSRGMGKKCAWKKYSFWGH